MQSFQISEMTAFNYFIFYFPNLHFELKSLVSSVKTDSKYCIKNIHLYKY